MWRRHRHARCGVAFHHSALFLLLLLLFCLQFDTGDVTTEIRLETVGTTSTTFLDVVFSHDDLFTDTGLTVTKPNPFGYSDSSRFYSVSYYYAGCINPLPTPIAGLTDVPLPYPTSKGSTTCGVGNNALCAKKTTFSYILQQLSDIANTNIKTASGGKSTVKFCVRYSLNEVEKCPPIYTDENGIEAANIKCSLNEVANGPSIVATENGNKAVITENGYKAADIKVSWTTANGFAGAVVTSVNGPDDESVNVGDVVVKAKICSKKSPTAPQSTFQQGEQIDICLSAKVATDSGSADLVVITRVDELRFWIDNDLSGQNGVYNVGETTQVGVAGGVVQTATKKLPTGNGDVVCDQAFAPDYDLNPDKDEAKGCVLTTFLGAPFFFESTVNTDGNNNVQFAGMVTIQFSNGNRGRVLLQDGEVFNKPFVAEVVTVPDKEDGDSDEKCECDGFFAFICWIMCLLKSIFG
jgi:hypothetical protein